MAHARLGKWGNNLAVRLPDDIFRAARLRDGEHVEIEAQADGVVIRRMEPPVQLGDLFRGKSAKAWRALYAGGYDWRPEIGREIVEE